MMAQYQMRCETNSTMITPWGHRFTSQRDFHVNTLGSRCKGKLTLGVPLQWIENQLVQVVRPCAVDFARV